MWKQKLIGISIVLSIGLLLISNTGYAQTTTRVTGSGISKGLHFQIETTSSGITTIENFFPVGWYINHAAINSPSTLQAMKDAGINTVVIEAHDIISANGLWPPSYSNLHASIDHALSILDNYNMKAVIDLAPFLYHRNYPPVPPVSMEYSDFDYQALAQYIQHITQGIYSHVIFAYYISSEPTTARGINGINIPIQPQPMDELAKDVRNLDPDHPCYIDAESRSYAADGYLQSAYDIFGNQLYNVHMSFKEYVSKTEDYNQLAEGAHYSFDMVKQNDKYGFITLGSAQDKLNRRSFREMTSQEEFYQTLSPIIHGARGIFYWWHPSATDEMQTLTHQMTTFLTSRDNKKGSSIADALMEDEAGSDRTSQLQIADIQINGNTSIPIHGTPVNFTDKNILEQNYTSFRFNGFEAGGSVYKLAAQGTTWIEETTNYGASADASCIDMNTAWAAGRIVWDLAIQGNTIIAANENCGQLWSAPLSSMNWSASLSWNGACSPDRDIVRVFGALPSGSTLIAGGSNGHWYTYDPNQTNACLRWQDMGRITAIDPHNTNAISTAASITSFTSTGGTVLYAGSLNGLYFSTNNGVSWIIDQAVSPLLRNNPSESGSDAATDPYPVLSLATDAVNQLYIGSFGRIITKAVNGTFTASTYTNSGLPNQPIYSLRHRHNGVNDVMFAGTGDGLYYCDLNASTPSWSPIPGLPTGTRVWDIAISSTNIVYMATSSGVYRITTSTLSIEPISTGLPVASISSGVEYRSITVDANDNVYVGSRACGNSFANTQDFSTQLSGAHRYDFPLFNYLVKKHNGSYYIFAANDFRPTLSMKFNLDDIIDNDETVYRVVEMNIDGTDTQLNPPTDYSIGSYNFSASFGAYQARVFRLDILKWSNIFAMERECDLTNVDCGTHAGGITIGDFDHDGKKDLLAMWIPALATPSTTVAEPFRFKIGWNIQNPLHRASTNVPFDASTTTAMGNFSVKNPGKCYGEVERVLVWHDEYIRGGDVKAWHFGYDDGAVSNTTYDVFFMGMPNPAVTGPGYDDYRVKFLWDLNRTGSINAPVNYFESYYSNFPAPPASPAFGHLQIGRSGGTTAATGGGMTFYKNPIEGGLDQSRPELMLMHLMDESQANHFQFTTSRNMYLTTSTNPWSQIQYDITGMTQTAPSTIGWGTKGAGIDVGDLYPGYQPANIAVKDEIKELVAGGIETTQNEFRFIVYNFNPKTGMIDQTWRPAIKLPISNGEIVKDAGLALSDIDGDGDDDLIIMAIPQNCSSGRPMFIRFGINTLINNNNSYKKEAPMEETEMALEDTKQGIKPSPGTPVNTILQNQPNPFSTGTVISYRIDRAAYVELEVYSMLGEIVYHANVGLQNAGTYQLPFNGTNLFDGIYMCRLKIDGTVVNSSKMLLLK